MAIGSRILSVNGTATADKAAIASVLKGIAEGSTVSFDMEVILPEPPSRPGASKSQPPPRDSQLGGSGIPEGDPAGSLDVWGPLTASLMESPQLVRLELGDNPLGCSGVQALVALALSSGRHSGFRHLGLARTGLGEGGLKAINAMLSHASSTVCTVDLGGNNMGGSLSRGIGFGREGRGPRFQFEQLLLRR